jgi:hypothetical protein
MDGFENEKFFQFAFGILRNFKTYKNSWRVFENQNGKFFVHLGRVYSECTKSVYKMFDFGFQKLPKEHEGHKQGHKKVCVPEVFTFGFEKPEGHKQGHKLSCVPEVFTFGFEKLQEFSFVLGFLKILKSF